MTVDEVSSLLSCVTECKFVIGGVAFEIYTMPNGQKTVTYPPGNHHDVAKRIAALFREPVLDDARISTGDAAKMLGVDRQTIRNYIHEGHLEAMLLPSGDFRVWRSDVLAWGGNPIKLSDANNDK